MHKNRRNINVRSFNTSPKLQFYIDIGRKSGLTEVDEDCETIYYQTLSPAKE